MARHSKIIAPLVFVLALLLALPNAALAASFTLTPAQAGVAAGQTININGTGLLERHWLCREKRRLTSRH